MMDEIEYRSSIVDPMYLRGDFFKKSHGDADAAYKVRQLENLLHRNIDKICFENGRIADIGCGTGITTHLLQNMLTASISIPIWIDGFDVHPFVSRLQETEYIRFFMGDYCQMTHKIKYDLAVLFDVVEHVPSPMDFLRDVAKTSRIIALHIPLDDSLFSWMRNLQRTKLSHPGHLITLDVASAINLLTFSSLRIIDFSYSPVFRAPSGGQTLSQRLMNPLREILFRSSPYLTQKILGGVSLNVLAWTPDGLRNRK